MHISKILRVAFVPVALAGCSEFFGDDSDSFSSAPPAHGAPPVVAAPPAPPAPPGPRPHRGHPGQRPDHRGPAVPPGPKTLPSTHSSCSCPVEQQQQIPAGALPMPAPALVAPAAPAAEWHPREGDLVRAGDLVVQLRRQNGGVSPSHAAMSTHIQNNMGLTAPQAELVLEELGL